ncbi:MAG: N-acetylglucosamine kinase, partial [Rhizobiaceae bacterium]
AEFSGSPEEIVLFAKSAKPVDFGRFAPQVIEHLGKGDTNARALIEHAALSIDAAFDALALETNDQIALLGGLAKHYPPYLAPRHAKRLVEPKADALMGALALAGKLAAGEPHIGGGRA